MGEDKVKFGSDEWLDAYVKLWEANEELVNFLAGIQRHHRLQVSRPSGHHAQVRTAGERPSPNTASCRTRRIWTTCSSPTMMSGSPWPSGNWTR